MTERRPFLLRIDPEVYAALQRWASDDLRSLNAQMEFVLRRALVGEHRLAPKRGDGAGPGGEGADGPPDVGGAGRAAADG